MASIDDVSTKLGEYMLQGWVLTDISCSTPGCAIPLMRSPKGRNPPVHLCVKCDADSASASKTALSIKPHTSSSSDTSGSHPSRASTPPTEISSALSSPVFAPPAETEELRRRREQSDTASAEIGKRLLKGWAMLGDECLNHRCYGVPLVRPPRIGGERDPREECVICGTVYGTQPDSTGRERLVPMNSSNPGTAQYHHSPMPAQLRERSLEQASQAYKVTVAPPALSHGLQSNSTTPPGDLEQVLSHSAQALQSTLWSLSTKLSTLSSSQNTTDLVTLGTVAETLTKVVQALSQVRQLQHAENPRQ